MRARVFSSMLVGAMLLGLGTVRSAASQSLADAARAAEEHRKATKEPGKVYTNKDLRPVPPPSAQPAPAGGEEAPRATAEAADKDKDKKDAKEKDEASPAPKNAEYWRKRMTDLQTQLDRDQTYLDAVQSRINALTTEFVNRDDPAQRAVIERERTRNLGELDRLRKAIETDRKAIADLEEDARRAGVPPGWLR